MVFKLDFDRLNRPAAAPPPPSTPRKIRQPLNTREWLGDMLRFNGRDADRARELLDRLDEVDGGAYDDEMTLIAIAEQSGDQTLDTVEDVAKAVKERKELIQWADRDETFREFTGVQDDGLDSRMEAFARAYDKLEAQANQLRELMAEAGLLRQGDHQTDPLPLLRMFLPVD